MKIAVLSDIHGNHYALEAVLNEAAKAGIERIFVLGDVVGYYYHPDKVIQLLEKWPVEIIQGNHERMLKRAVADPGFLVEVRTKYGSGLDRALVLLSYDQITELIGAPSNKDVSIDNLQIGLFHGSPWDSDSYIYPDADRKILDKATMPQYDYVFLGHTHYPFSYYNGNTVLVNPGSVGQFRGKGGVATWVMLDTSNWSLVFKHTAYDVSTLIEEVKKTDPEIPYLQQVLKR